jgi:hypothetical protein
MLADVLAGESPAGGGYPCDTVVISDVEEGDRIGESSDVKVPEGWAESPVWSDRGASNSTGRSERANQEATKLTPHRARTGGDLESAERLTTARRPAPPVKSRWVNATGGLSGVLEGGTPRKNGQRKHGTSRGSPRPEGTAKAPRITSTAGKSRRAHEWGGWGRLSIDGPGQKNPDRSEGPWGRAATAARMAAAHRAEALDSERDTPAATGDAKDGSKLSDVARERRTGRPRLTASLGAVLGKTRRTES